MKQDFMEVMEFLNPLERFAPVGAKISKGVLLVCPLVWRWFDMAVGRGA